MLKRTAASCLIVIAVIATIQAVYQNSMVGYVPGNANEMLQLTNLTATWLAPVATAIVCLCWTLIQEENEQKARENLLEATVRR